MVSIFNLNKIKTQSNQNRDPASNNYTSVKIESKNFN